MKSFRVSAVALTVLLSAANCFAFGSSAPQPDPSPTPTQVVVPQPADLLCDAIHRNDLPAATQLLAAGLLLTDVKCTEVVSRQIHSPLWSAVITYEGGSCPTMDMINLLIKSGANINEILPEYSNYTPIAYAIAKLQSPALANNLLDHGANVVPSHCDNGCGNLTPIGLSDLILTRVQDADWVALLSRLLDLGMPVTGLPLEKIQAQTDDLWLQAANLLAQKRPNQALFGDSLAYTLVGDGISSSIIDWAVSHGVKFDATPSGQTSSPFQTALVRSTLVTIQMLMTHLNRAIVPSDLFYAVQNRNDGVAEFVLQATPNISAQQPDGTTILMTALLGNWNATYLQAVIVKKQDLSLERNQEPSFALEIAAQHSSTDIVNELLAAGADANQVSSIKQETALQAAIGAGQESSALQLLQVSQKSINNVDQDGYTALTLASSKGYSKLVTAIVATHGVDLNAQDLKGETPLMYAVLANNVPSVVELLVHGACIKVIDNTGHTAQEMANDRNYTDVLKVLMIYLSQPGHC